MSATTGETLWSSIERRAAEERERVQRGASTVKRAELEAELTPFGKLRWYLHNDLEEPVTRSLYFCEIEIPPGSRTGKLRHQGGIVHLVAEGRGFTRFDDVDHAWEHKDCIALPVRPLGVEFQHFNDGTGPARLLMSWPNLDSALSPEMGVRLEVLEPCPEYDEAD